MAIKAKTIKKGPTKKATAEGTRLRARRGTVKASKLLKSLPESVEHIEIVQQIAGVLEELQNRVLDVKEEASKELSKLMKRYEANYKGLEKKVHQVTLEAKKQAQTSMIHLLQKWHEHKEKLPKPLTKEIEKIVEQIGTKVVAAKPAKKATAKKATVASSIKKKRGTTARSASKKPMASMKEIHSGDMPGKASSL
jgi:hypothetical protein